jgi:hypothetical protein
MGPRTLAQVMAERFTGPVTGETALDDLGEERRDAESVTLYWIPLGSGQRVVRLSGRVFEAVSALLGRRARCDLYHGALVVETDRGRFSIEVAPEPDAHGGRRGVIGGGPVGSRWLGRFRVFRYEVRCWRNGVIPDLGFAVSVVDIDVDGGDTDRLLNLLPTVPTPVWGRDELGAGEMWNSNSVVAWLLTLVGVDLDRVALPPGGRAPGWDAGRAVARRQLAVAASGPDVARSVLHE